MTPKGKLVQRDATHGRHIVAFGEATGHHHSFAAADGALLEDEAGDRWVQLAAEVDALPVVHQEHDVVTLTRTRDAEQLYQGDVAFQRTQATPPGVYRVVRKRTYDLASGEARPVRD